MKHPEFTNPASQAKKTIWITGASSGIGESCAYLYARRGWNLILTARHSERLEKVCDSCRQLGAACVPLPRDLSDVEHIEELADKALQAFGKIDVAFLNAGISQRSRITETSNLVEDQIMAVNFFAPTRIAKRLLPAMIRQGGGVLAVTTSIAGKFGFPLRSAYASSKFALYGFFETLQAEYYDRNIRAVMVCPGRVQTRISHNALEADGRKHAVMDDGQQQGISAEEAAKQIAKAIDYRKPEVLVGGKELLMVHIKRFFPALARRLVRKIKAT